MEVLLTRVRQRSLLCMFRSASDAIILSIIPRCLLHSSCRMRVRANTHAHVNTMHTEHMRFRMSYNACTHTCALAHLSTYVVTLARTHIHTHTHSLTQHASTLSLSLSSLSRTNTHAHTHNTHNTVARQFYIISLYYIHLSLLPPYESTYTHLQRGRGEGV